MVGSTIATPISAIELCLDKGDPIYVSTRNLKEVTQKITEYFGRKELLKFKKILIREIIRELRSLPPSRQYGMNKYLRQSEKPLREQIIDAVKVGAEKYDEKTIEKMLHFKDGKISLKLTIDHPLVQVLEYGTKGMTIRPANKKYMFIPGPEYAENFYKRKYGDKSSIRFTNAKKRMVHAKAMIQSEKYKGK